MIKKLSRYAAALTVAGGMSYPANALAACFETHASYYADYFHGRTTANGETFNMHAMTAAHKTLPFGTQLRVTNESNGESVVVRVNDRGPFIRGRGIDLSKGAAQQIGMINAGVARVQVCQI